MILNFRGTKPKIDIFAQRKTGTESIFFGSGTSLHYYL
jgi:hypothetical protein